MNENEKRHDLFIFNCVSLFSLCSLQRTCLLGKKKYDWENNRNHQLNYFANPETAKTRNSKWAKVTYRVDGKIYVSGNRIQVPLTAQVGNSVTVRYDLQHPERLYSYSLARIVVSLFVTVVCIVVGVFHLA